tara:strand:- start:156 stop:944 length:789 start_codon:yes stop_codon:yes gene_type:complete
MLISILMPTFNSESYISKAIHYLNIQSNTKDFEVIFADGMSTDRTAEIIRSECRVNYQLIEKQDLNMYDAINKAIDQAKGKYLIFLNSDDRLYDNSVIENISTILKDSDAGICYCSDICKLSFDGSTSKTYRYTNFSYEELLLSRHSTFLPHPGLIISREDYDTLGGFDVTLGPASDYDFCLRVLKQFKVLRIPLITHEFVRRKDSLSHIASFQDSHNGILKLHRLYDDYSMLQRVFGFYRVWFRYKLFNLIHLLKDRILRL